MSAPRIRAVRPLNKHRRKRSGKAKIDRAIALLEQRMFKRSFTLACPQTVRQYLRLVLAGEDEEVFATVFLDTQLRVIAFEPLFRGTIDCTTIHTRVIIKRALKHNAAYAIVAHNHPSGLTTPSESDIVTTLELKTALRLFDIHLLDHLVIGEGEPFSFVDAEIL
ncbi:DNA repair protein RadC [Pseudomonas chlororaphis subsp. piscium]|uniref:JAB domain-containing protein n=1 Tax=Pseudomonas chlororaphis TaxID=587753 RepID=UPI000F55FA93|nr:JAB domain-containing protein [Pseudomonas chlororaphis]AZD86879.1 DNA repair protein RadC [Pseudomonas chlororaphis subsp. aureofaciens]UQS88737.1 DNA repair protein RadC [Pseudomonas chlororaphis subsp. piscium]